MRFRIRVGRTTKSFSSTQNVVTKHLEISDHTTQGLSRVAVQLDEVKKILRNALSTAAQRSSAEKIQAGIVSGIARVNSDISDDIDAYVKEMIKFFFSIQSARSADRVIYLQDLDRPVQSSGFTFGRSYAGDSPNIIRWAPLSAATLKRKGGETRYFVFTHQLKADLQDMLPDFIKDILQPGLKITFIEPDDQSGQKTKTPVAHIELIVATSNFKGNSPSQISFQRGEIFSAEPMNVGVLRRYLQSEVGRISADNIAYKLTNAGEGEGARPQRPFLEPAISYWVLKRFPYIVEQSVKRHLLNKVAS